jgi:hypothetical protein
MHIGVRTHQQAPNQMGIYILSKFHGARPTGSGTLATNSHQGTTQYMIGIQRARLASLQLAIIQSLIPILTLHNPICTPTFPQHLAQPLREIGGSLPTSKVASFLIDLLEHNRTHRMPPALGIVTDFDGEVGYSQRHVYIARHNRYRYLSHVMQCFVIDVRSCVRAGPRENVDADPEADFVFSPGVSVRPVDQLVPDPGEEANWRVSQSEVDCGWLLGCADKLESWLG